MREENSVKVPHPRSEALVISMYHSKSIANFFTDFNRVETSWFSISKSKYVSALRQLKIQLVSPIQLKAHLVSLFRRAYWWSSQTFLMELFLTVNSFTFLTLYLTPFGTYFYTLLPSYSSATMKKTYPRRQPGVTFWWMQEKLLRTHLSQAGKANKF